MSIWYNNKTNELTTTAPWGDKWVAPELVEMLYSDWTQVAEGFTPPVLPKTQEQLIAELNHEFEPKFKENDAAYIVAMRYNNSTLMQELQTERETLVSDYNTRMEAIVNG